MGRSNVLASALGDGLSDLLDLGAGDEERNVEAVVTESLERELAVDRLLEEK